MEWVQRWATDEFLSILDIGGRDINGTSRHLFPNATYTVLDIVAGADVDLVADASTWTPDREYDTVICTEVFEHTAAWREIVKTAHKALRPGGRFVTTMAGPGRGEHSAVDGHWGLYPGEHYANIHEDDLGKALVDAGFVEITVERAGLDVRGTALHP